MIKKILFLICIVFSTLLLSACGSANFAPGRAYMEPTVGVTEG